MTTENIKPEDVFPDFDKYLRKEARARIIQTAIKYYALYMMVKLLIKR